MAHWGFLACAFATRATAGLSLIFFLLTAINSPNQRKHLAQLITPLIVVWVVLSAYNLERFGSIIEQGYSHQMLITPLEKARSYGIFYPIHVPTNLYYFLLNPPVPVFKDQASHVLKFPFVRADYWGMSILITSPYFLWLLKSKKWNRVSNWMVLTILCIAIPIFFYYGVGVTQYGYRYSLDFLPLLFFLLMTLYFKQNKNVSLSMKSIFVLTGITNFYLFLTFMKII